MNGQTKPYNPQQKEIDIYLRTHNPYIRPQPIKFDLRGYVSYVKENKITDPNDIPDEIIQSLYKRD